MKCTVGHEIKTETGFKVFEAGQDYAAEETTGRERYFGNVDNVEANFGDTPFVHPIPEGFAPIDKPSKGKKEL